MTGVVLTVAIATLVYAVTAPAVVVAIVHWQYPNVVFELEATDEDREPE